MDLKGNSFANAPNISSRPGKRHQYGMPPPPTDSWSLTGWAVPE